MSPVRKPAVRAMQARWVTTGCWVPFRKTDKKLVYLPVSIVHYDNVKQSVTISANPTLEDVDILKCSFFDLVSYQLIYPHSADDIK